jgi:methionyl-tRNA synthetase
MSLDIPMPKKVFGHPWLIMADGKMSKSVGNVVYADDLVEKYGVDAVRYYFLHEIPFANDGVFTEDLLVERINGDLANILGNLVNRTISMSNKYFDGVVETTGVEETMDAPLKELVTSLGDKVAKHMNDLRIADAIDDVFEVLRASNKYIDETMPWALAKEEDKKDRLKEVLYNLIESIRVCAVYLQAFLPETADKIFYQINTDIKSYESTKEFGKYVSGTKVNNPEILFARIDTTK